MAGAPHARRLLALALAAVPACAGAWAAWRLAVGVAAFDVGAARAALGATEAERTDAYFAALTRLDVLRAAMERDEIRLALGGAPVAPPPEPAPGTAPARLPDDGPGRTAYAVALGERFAAALPELREAVPADATVVPVFVGRTAAATDPTLVAPWVAGADLAQRLQVLLFPARVVAAPPLANLRIPPSRPGDPPSFVIDLGTTHAALLEGQLELVWERPGVRLFRVPTAGQDAPTAAGEEPR